MKLQVPVMCQVRQPDNSWKEEFQNGPIGGFTYPSGEKALIYQCGNCGELCKHNTNFNDHRERKHGEERCQFGWADGPPDWQELDITEEMIYGN